MKSKITCAMIFALTVFGFSVVVTNAQKVDPKLNPKLKNIKVPKPDLLVSDVQVTKTSDNLIEKISVKVTNVCKASAPASYLSIVFKAGSAQDAKALLYVGNTTLSLKPGESRTQTFDVTDKKIPAASFVEVKTDSENKVSEGDENNNWRRVNPNSSPFPTAGNCDPK